MYSKLMWCGVSLVLNKLKPDHIQNAKTLELVIVESKAKHNKYDYIFKINDKLFNCEFVFSTNVCVHGTVNITDMSTGVITEFTTEHLATATKCSLSSSEFNEFYTCYDKCFIDLTIVNNKILDVAALEIIKTKSEDKNPKFILSHISIGAPLLGELDPIFIKTLFAATAAMDYGTTVCSNPVFIGKNNVNITIFNYGGRRILCLTKPCEHVKDANIIQLINSDFKQIIQYNTPNSNSSTMEEYVLGNDDGPVLRRNYICCCNEAMNEVLINNKNKYNITVFNNDIIFKKI
jgi:hypothetical protein